MAGDISSINSNIFTDVKPEVRQPVKELGRDEFLKLLTYQLKEQNPLDPTDNSEFAAQLAQFSQLEQLTDIRAALENQIQTNLLLSQSITNVSAASLIGKSVKAYSSALHYDGATPVKLGYNLLADAKAVTVEIRDSRGNLVKTIEPTLERKQGDNTLMWDGTNGDGNKVASGSYTFTVKAQGKDDIALEADTFTYGKVDSVRFKSEGAMLVIDGHEIALSDITDITE